MADTIFCLDIHEDTIVALAIDNSTDATVVQGCAKNSLETAPFPSLLEDLKEQTGFTEGGSRIAFGAELFSYRTLTLPFSDKSKIEQILPLELADASPVDVDDLVIDFVISKITPEGTEVLAAMIDKEVFTDCLASLNGAGLDPEKIGISGVEEAIALTHGEETDFILIDIGSSWATVIVVKEANIALIRSISTPPEIFATDTEIRNTDFALNIKQTLLISGMFDIHNKQSVVFLTGTLSPYQGLADILSTTLEDAVVKLYIQSQQPLIKIAPEIESSYAPEEMDRVLTLAQSRTTKQNSFNFRKGAFKKRKTPGDYRSLFFRFAVPALAILISGIGYWIYTYTSLQSQQDELNKQIVQVFKETLPGVTRIVNPIQQLSVKNNEIKTTYRPGGLSGSELTIIELMAELSSRIPAAYQVTVVRLVADTEVIRIKAITVDFNTVDNVQKELEKSPFFKSVSISSANQSPKGDEVSFELKIQRT
ncbi:type II secretion system protein GspL [Desulforhopalus sp. 52FAK]